MNSASETLFALKPVTFRYKKEIDPKSLPQFGLVAENGERVNPHLVIRDKQIAALSADLQKVNAQIAVSKLGAQVVNNP